MKKAFLGIAILIVAAAAVVAADWRLYLRFVTMPNAADDPSAALWYEPKVAVGSGVGKSIPSAADGDTRLPAEVLDAAWAYAQETGTDALIVAYDGEIQLEKYADGVDANTLFQSQSLHKGLTAIALGAAIRDGAVRSMDTPAADYLVEWQADERKARITLADLAYMQGGIERPQYSNSPFSPGIKMFLSGKLTQLTLGLPAVAEPRETYIWSNASTQALAIAIERAVGRPWADFLRDALWSPLGAGEAWVQLDRPGGSAQAFCCFVSNARNWLRIGELLRNDGMIGDTRLLPAGWVRTMTTAGVTNPNYGMQLWVNEPYTGEFLLSGRPEFRKKRSERLAARDAFYVEGHFAQRLHVVPSAGLVVVRFGEDVTDWDDARLMNDMIRAAHELRRPVGLPAVPPPPGDFVVSGELRAPDYTDIADWAAHPAWHDVSDLDPPGFERPEVPRADAFYINPTTYRGPTWNASVDDPAANDDADSVVLAQGSVLAGCCNVYAPRYRQATSASVGDGTGNGMKAFAFAFEDVRRAFREFVALSDRPFVILGHSQGGFHLQRLLTEEIAGTPLAERLVAAYVVGISTPVGMFDGPWKGLVPCDTATATGCVASWSTFGPTADPAAYAATRAQLYPDYVGDDGLVELICTNPLTGDSSAAASSENDGAVALPATGGYLGPRIPGLVGARCDRGMLVLDGDPGARFAAKLLPGDNYHFYDVALFYANIRNDASVRVDSWQARGGARQSNQAGAQ